MGCDLTYTWESSNYSLQIILDYGVYTPCEEEKNIFNCKSILIYWNII